MSINDLSFTLIFLFIGIPVSFNLIYMGVKGLFKGSVILRFNGLLGFFPLPTSPSQKRALAQSAITGFRARFYGFFLLLIGIYLLLIGLDNVVKFILQIIHR